MASELLICTDLDRTLIANGHQEESRQARERFDALASRPEITLTYVTGRHLDLVQQAISEFKLPFPDYLIADVGTSVYCGDANGSWRNLDAWQTEIARDWGQMQAADLHVLLKDLADLSMQENSKQNSYKLSYYFPAAANSERLAQYAQQKLKNAGVRARVIVSRDEIREIGLLDVVPERSSKLHAIQYLMNSLGVTSNRIVFSGDSGNDLEVLVSAIPAVLVANASEGLKVRARQLSDEAGNSEFLYIASGGFLGMNGCYSAGILEGIAHYHPHLIEWMQTPNGHPARTGMGNR